jgi:hypothetical protein
MLDLLLDHGADTNAKSQWWAGRFGLMDCAPDGSRHLFIFVTNPITLSVHFSGANACLNT